ncbi:MAG: hypothetical protein II877_07825 [Synergistaceae bacterium]|nr:hypothetical protein [Synergistaceae bacterium]MBQ7169979.1 hypothetical protein [Synergistaceae bacterium]
MAKVNEFQEEMMFLLHDSALLNPNGCATLKNIASVFGVSPSTVSLHINRARYKRCIQTLEAENSELRARNSELEAELYSRDTIIRRVS